jgi:hypothetical protein
MQDVPLPTSVGQWNATVFWLKQTTNFKSTQHKNIQTIISKELEPIHVSTA